MCIYNVGGSHVGLALPTATIACSAALDMPSTAPADVIPDVFVALPETPYTAPLFIASHDEVLMMIVGYVRLLTDYQDRSRYLLALSAVNRRLRGFVLPFAVAHVVVQYPTSFAGAMQLAHAVTMPVCSHVK